VSRRGDPTVAVGETHGNGGPSPLQTTLEGSPCFFLVPRLCLGMHDRRLCLRFHWASLSRPRQLICLTIGGPGRAWEPGGCRGGKVCGGKGMIHNLFLTGHDDSLLDKGDRDWYKDTWRTAMKRQRAQILIGILFCASMAFAHADDMIRSLSCPCWKMCNTNGPAISPLTPACCGSAQLYTAGSDSLPLDFDLQPDTNQESGCCGRGCCNPCQAMIFLTTTAHSHCQLPNFPSVFEMTQSVPYSDFSRLLFRPPQV